MSIVLIDIEIPKEPTPITLYPDGSWNDYTDGTSGEFAILPKGHGRLIEKKSARAKFCQFCFWKHQNEDACERCAGCPIDFIPTIVPAEGGGEDGV